MLMIARDRSYSELLENVRGKKVLIWTCDTCARLCNDIGGKESAERLAAALADDGVDVAGVMSTSASCIEKKVISKRDGLSSEYDSVIALTCNIGAFCAGNVFGKDVINPIVTIGPGYIDAHRNLQVCGNSDRGISSLEDEAKALGLKTNPFA